MPQDRALTNPPAHAQAQAFASVRPPVRPPAGSLAASLVRVMLGLFSSAWAVTLAIAGLWLCFTAPVRWPMIGSPLILAGVAVFAAGVLVFGVLVADRLFPGAERRLAWGVELCSSLFMISGAAALALALLAR